MTPSPCTNICQIDTVSGLCLGCFRTLDEIARWSRLDDGARAAILVAVAGRRQAHLAPPPDEVHAERERHD